MKAFAGYLMIGALFSGLFVLVVREFGWRDALTAFGGVAAIVAWCAVAAWLIAD